ncbi:capsular polysaccharide synthesis protein [Bacillus gobiensis]|uniref:capsular polysaccharide synthesis protein n=1 Tax=Bacillus gobiensis TaxID=1441095 RepID=UPI003D1C6D04
MKIKKVIIKFINITRDYNLLITLKLFLNKLINEDNYNNLVKKILINENEIVLKNYSTLTYKNDTTNEHSPIWVCWWQGYDNMPQLVSQCYESIIDNCNNHEVKLITKDNYADYVDIPDYIVEKLNNGYITITHFSDILRVALLYKYGGCWIDATIYISSKIPEEVFTYPVYSRKISESTIYEGKNVSQGRWSAYLLAGQKECALFKFLEELFFNYWKKHNALIDYFLIDYAIAIGVEKVPHIKNLILDIPVNNSQIHELQKKLNNEFAEDDYMQICSNTVFHKLNWRLNYLTYKANKKTYFGKIFSEM